MWSGMCGGKGHRESSDLPARQQDRVLELAGPKLKGEEPCPSFPPPSRSPSPTPSHLALPLAHSGFYLLQLSSSSVAASQSPSIRFKGQTLSQSQHCPF